MDDLSRILALLSVLGSGAVGGTFFAFSSFVMRALGRLPAAQGLAAMQCINVVVIRPSFLGAFLGTALLSLGAIVLAAVRWGEPGSVFLALGGALYAAGTFLVTVTRNVPLNDALEKLDPADARAAGSWERYQRRWTAWNHARTTAALLAALAFSLALAGPAR